MNSIYVAAKPGISSSTAAPQSTRLLGQMRERLRYLHYSLRTEQTYVYWARWFIRFHGLRHPREMGKGEVEAFLSMLANDRKVSVSTHRQALSALLFLYKEVLSQDLPWLGEIGRPVPKRRIPSVLTVALGVSFPEVVDRYAKRYRTKASPQVGAFFVPRRARAQDFTQSAK